MAKTKPRSKPKPLLELSTLRERKRWITIDGNEYTLHDPASMGVQHQAAVLHAAQKMSELGATAKEISPAEADCVLELVTDATMLVVEAPREVIVQLTIPQMVQIINVFTSSAGLANPPTLKPKNPGTGAKSFQRSRGSTAEA